MAVSDAKKRSNAKYDIKNYQYITFKAQAGSRDKIKAAAEVAGQSLNGFIRDVLNKAVLEATGEPMENKKSEE
jgi:uncharacterized protein (DUF1778 family)